MSYKILSLDGGGSWALMQARILQDIYGDINGQDQLCKFDLVIVNSGVSLVLACLLGRAFSEEDGMHFEIAKIF